MANTETKQLYNGEVEITFYPDSHRYKLTGEKTYLTSVTAITGLIDKSKVLIPWAVGLTGTFLRKFLEEHQGEKFTSEEFSPIIEEALVQHQVKKDESAGVGSEVHDMAQRIGEALRDDKSIDNIVEEINDMESASKNNEISEAERERFRKIVNGISAFINWVVEHKVKFLECERMIYSRKYGYVGITDVIIEIDGRKILVDYKTSKGVYSEMKYQIAGYVQGYEEETKQKLDGSAIAHFNKETGEFVFEEISEEDNLKNQETFLHLVAVKNREKELTKY